MLLEKDISFQYIEVNPYHKPESLLSLNPRGLVPTLEYHSKPLYESTVICEFLEDAYPATKRLLPADAYDRARSRIWAGFVESRIIPAYYRFLQYQSKGEDDRGLERMKEEFVARLREFEAEMHATGPYFFGEGVSLVDLTLAPFAERFWALDHFKGGFGSVGARWDKWLDAVGKRESMVTTLSEREHYIPLYQRYANDTAQSELAKATREGRGVP